MRPDSWRQTEWQTTMASLHAHASWGGRRTCAATHACGPRWPVGLYMCAPRPACKGCCTLYATISNNKAGTCITCSSKVTKQLSQACLKAWYCPINLSPGLTRKQPWSKQRPKTTAEFMGLTMQLFPEHTTSAARPD